MGSSLSPETRERLGKLVALLASDQSGEVAAAAAAIGRTLSAAGADWHDLAEIVTNDEASPDWLTQLTKLNGLSNDERIELETKRQCLAILKAEFEALQHRYRQATDYQAGFAEGRKAGLRDAPRNEQGRIDRLELELEAFRAACPWAELVEKFCHKHQRGPLKGYAKELKFRFCTNRLGPQDQITLRRFQELLNRPRGRKRKDAAA
jgi:hypothetical protein